MINTDNALHAYITWRETPSDWSEEGGKRVMAVADDALAHARTMTVEDLRGVVAWAEQQPSDERETSLSREQINLSGVLVKLVGEDVGGKVAGKLWGDDRHWHIAMFTDKAGATKFMLALLDTIWVNPVDRARAAYDTRGSDDPSRYRAL